MNISFADHALPAAGTLVAFVTEERRLSPTALSVDKASSGILSRTMAMTRFLGRREETLAVTLPTGSNPDRVILIGLGKAANIDETTLQAVGGSLANALNRVGEEKAMVAVDGMDGVPTPAIAAADIAFGALLGTYRFDRYRSREKKENKPSLKNLTFMSNDSATASTLFQSKNQLAEGVFLTRDLVSEPANVITPLTLAERCLDLREVGIEVEILDEGQMRAQGMLALLGVAQGSANPPRLIVLRWSGADETTDNRPAVLVGKGVTFDTGGISLKPGAGMWDMKWDMAGAGAVIGAMRAIAGRKAKANVVAIIGAVENMPSGTAQRPGDIVVSMSGQTIEVLNTDAEGRLVLADAITYAQTHFQPRLMIDLATLTGAVVVALGTEHAGLFSNDDGLANSLIAAGSAVGEKLWRLPLAEAYDRLIDADQADMKNITGDRNAGATIGAQFIKRFVDGVPWAHLDVAGVVWSGKDQPTTPKGATGFGVRLLDRFIADHIEQR